ncbi:PAS domain S-box protein [Sulfurimicrobium lacus]|uniref:PAS domain S-box protein n=1 Tax=Sulfurimicrobium lacus TaxID=2715678 RepID=UPI00156536E9|nr:PAS domain S-box protein [Sulfurimicrobium lacus]
MIRVVVLALAYFVAGWLGLQIPYVGSHITLVWLPTGIAVAGLLRWGWGVWPGVLLGAFFVNLSIGSPVLLAASIAVGNTLGPLLTTAWLKRAKFHGAFDRRRDVGTFISAASAGMTVSASCGVASLHLAGLMPYESTGSAWLSWWMGDTVGVLLAASFLLTLSRKNVEQQIHSRRELLLWALVAGPMAWLAFIYNYEQMGRSLPLVFLTLPLVAWIALRFGSTGAGLAGLGFSVLAAWGTAVGFSPFLLSDVHTSLFLLWSYMATTVLTGLLITALQAERLLAESTLRESEEKLRGLYELSPLGIALTDMKGRYVEFNEAFRDICGYPAEELKALDYWTLTPRKYEAEEARQLESLERNGRYGPYEKEYVRKDGSAVSLRLNGTLVSGNDGQKYIWSIVEDITERKAAEDELRKLSTVIEQSPASIVITDLDGTIQYVNPKFVEVTGYQPEEAIGCNPRILKSGLTPMETYQNLWQTIADGMVWHGELINKRKNSELYWEEVHLSPVKNAAGVSTHYVAVKIEITERKRSEETIRQNEARFRYMLETSPIAVRIASSSGRRVLFANQRYAELIDSVPDDVIGVDPKAYYARPEEYEEVLARLSRGDGVTNKLVELRMSGGKRKWALASYLTLEYGNESAVLGWFYDITERTQMETALRDSQARLVAAQQIARLGYWELDLATNRLWWSEEIFRIFEIDADSFGASYEAFLAAIHPDDRQAVNQAYLDSLENKASYEIEHRLLLPDGRVKYVHERCETEFGQDGKALRSMGTVQDITDRKLAETALQRSEGTSRALINATMETAILLDEEGTIIAINEVGAHRLLKEQHEIVGANFYALLPPDLAQSRKSFAAKVFQSGTAAHFQDIRDGIRFDINAYPVFDADGKVVNLAVYAADVTEQYQLQGVDQLQHGIDQQVLRGQSIQQIFEFICVEVARIFGYPYIWLGRKEPQGVVTIMADAGPACGYRGELESVGVRWDDTPQGKGPTGTTIRTGQAQVFNLSDAGFQPWRDSARRHNLKAILGLPLIIRGEIYGAFTVYSQHEHSFDDPDVLQHLSGIASRICVALETARDQQQVMLLSTALSATANGVFITDNSGRILWLNKAFTVLTGFGERDALGATPRILNSGKQDSTFVEKMWRDILRGDVWRNEMVDRRKDGSEFFVRQTITPMRDAHGAVSHFIAILEDISAEKEAEARIEHMAHYDSLTNLPNRALFLDRLRQTLASAKRASHPGALMFLDLDRFKSVNDTLGHHAGDVLLQQAATRIRACVRESDTVARLAGDEFTVILPEITVEEDAARVAEKILAVFAPPFDLDGHEVFISTSIGIALFPRDAADEDKMLKRADVAMYAAKAEGRNKFAFYREG